jgi:hypothetical protein
MLKATNSRNNPRHVYRVYRVLGNRARTLFHESNQTAWSLQAIELYSPLFPDNWRLPC